MKTIIRGAGLAWFASQTLCVSLWLASAGLAPAQTPVPVAPYVPLAADQLDTMVGPVALYPDPLLAEILAAATRPTEIVLADRYLSSGGEVALAGQMGWDASVVALTHYPTVLQWLDQNLSWTAELGQAFLNQQPDVMASVQRLRRKAETLGNLQSTAQETVQDDGVAIEIVPVNPTVIYLPVYVTAQVYFETAPVVPLITFGPPCGVGDWLECDIDWHRRRLLAWDADHPRPVGWWHARQPERESVTVQFWHPTPHDGYKGHFVHAGYDGHDGHDVRDGHDGHDGHQANSPSRAVAPGVGLGGHAETSWTHNSGNPGNSAEHPARMEHPPVAVHPPTPASVPSPAPGNRSYDLNPGTARSFTPTPVARTERWPSSPPSVSGASGWSQHRTDGPGRSNPSAPSASFGHAGEATSPRPGNYVPAPANPAPRFVPPPTPENNSRPTYRYDAPEPSHVRPTVPTHTESPHENTASHSSSSGSSGGSVGRAHDANNTTSGNRP